MIINIKSLFMEHLYEVDLNWVKDRAGVLFSPDFNDETTVVTPPQFPGGIPGYWSPEHLFTAAINSCLMTTFLAIAEKSGLVFSAFSSRAYGKLDDSGGKLLMTQVTLKPVVVLENELDVEKARRVLQKSEAACLISNSVRSEIIFEPEVRVKT